MPRASKHAAPQPALENLLTPERVAEMLGVTTGALAQWRYLGTGPEYVKLSGRQVRYATGAVQRWLSAQSRTQT